MKRGVVYLDEPVIFEWTEDRPHMRPIFTTDMLDDPIDTFFMRERLTKAVEVTVESLNEHKQVIEKGLLENGIPPPWYYSREDGMLFREQEYLTRKYNKMMISKNNYVISMLQNLLKDVASLCRLIQVFPFLKYRIEITDHTCAAVLRNIKKCENDFLQENASSTSFLASILEQYEAKLKNVSKEPQFSWPLDKNDDQSQWIFDSFVLSKHAGLVKPLIDSFSPETFSSALQSCQDRLISSLDESGDSFDELTLFLVDFVFSRVDISFAKLDEPYFKLDVLRARKVRDFDLPAYFRSEGDLDVGIVEFVSRQSELVAGADALTKMMFEWSPTAVLKRVNEAMKHVQNFLTAKMKETGQEVVNFVSFDETFSGFVIALLCSSVCNLKGLVTFACTMIEEEQLSNDLGFAQVTLRSAYEYIETVANKCE